MTAEVPAVDGVPGEGWRGSTGSLRPPGRALEALADAESDRERVPDGAAADGEGEGLPEREGGLNWRFRKSSLKKQEMEAQIRRGIGLRHWNH